jgi:hypothetical protein
MGDGAGRILFAWALALLMLGATWLVLGFPGAGRSASRGYGAPRWYYPYFGGGHGGWFGRGFEWGSFGQLGDDDFRGGGPGSGK